MELDEKAESSEVFGEVKNEQSFVEFGDTMDKNYLETKELPKEFNGKLSEDFKEDKQQDFEIKHSKCLEQEDNFEPKSESSDDDKSFERDEEFIHQSMKSKNEVLANVINNDFSEKVKI